MGYLRVSLPGHGIPVVHRHREPVDWVQFPVPRMKPKVIIFDFWGTLAFFPMTDLKEFYSSLARFGFKIKTEKEIKHFSSIFSRLMCFSKDWIDFSKQIFKEFVENPKKEKIVSFADFLKEKIIFEFYDDVKEVLNLPFKKVILTNSARFLIENLEPVQRFSKIFTPKETGFLKPDPKTFLSVLKKLKVKPKQTIMVGDDIERDLMPAKDLKIKPVLIDRQNKFQDYPGLKINSLKELKNILPGL